MNHIFNPTFGPSFRNGIYPFNFAFLHRPITSNALSDGLGNYRLLECLVFLNSLLGLLFYCIDFCT